jgi:hypothetical protein
MSEGVIYILINEAMPGLTKIGKTGTNVEQRMRELDSTGVPLPFECFHASKVADLEFVERRLHDAFDDNRVRKRREFFRISPERVQSALMLAEIEDVTPRDDVVEDAEDQQALNAARQWRAPFNFEMVNIPVGSVLTFSADENVSATVAGARRIEFEGEETSLSASADTALRRLGYNWKSVQGPQYWMFEGETLVERRRRMEGDE